MREIALYVHVPFCLNKCRYCDFVSFPNRSNDCITEYFQLVSRELKIRVINDGLQGLGLKSLYFGGGTPSLSDPVVLSGFLTLLPEYFILSPSIEVTLEANPGTLTPQKLGDLADIGVNRLSLGVQSFQDRYLSFLGRTYRTADVYRLLDELVNSRIYTNFSVDLMYSLPFQTFSDWKKEIDSLSRYRPPHVSIYNLTLGQRVSLGPFFRRHRMVFPDQDWEAAIYRWTLMVLRRMGYDRYEISNFAQPGFECTHNLTYWRNQEYLGLGVSACSFLKGIRLKNTRLMNHYRKSIEMDHSPVVSEEALPLNQKLVEEMILALRTREGINTERLLQNYPSDLVETKLSQMYHMAKDGFLRKIEGGWVLSSRGTLIANQIFIDLMD